MPPVSSPGLGTPSGHRSPRPGSRESQLARVRFRRAITLLVMTLLLPGSAQLAAGRRDVGRVAIRVWLSVVGALVLALAVRSGTVCHGADGTAQRPAHPPAGGRPPEELGGHGVP